MIPAGDTLFTESVRHTRGKRLENARAFAGLQGGIPWLSANLPFVDREEEQQTRRPLKAKTTGAAPVTVAIHAIARWRNRSAPRSHRGGHRATRWRATISLSFHSSIAERAVDNRRTGERYPVEGPISTMPHTPRQRGSGFVNRTARRKSLVWLQFKGR